MIKRVHVSVLAALLVLLSACSSGGAPAPTLQNPAAPAPATSAPAATPTSAPTAALPSDIPIMPNATDLNVNDSDISFVIKSNLQNVMDFYSKELPGKGWKTQEQPSVIGSFGRMFFSNPDHQLSLLLSYSEPLNQVVVRMNIIQLNLPGMTPQSAGQ